MVMQWAVDEIVVHGASFSIINYAGSCYVSCLLGILIAIDNIVMDILLISVMARPVKAPHCLPKLELAVGACELHCLANKFQFGRIYPTARLKNLFHAFIIFMLLVN